VNGGENGNARLDGGRAFLLYFYDRRFGELIMDFQKKVFCLVCVGCDVFHRQRA
jgi:hypothetical protein